jgi:hypothetical protein
VDTLAKGNHLNDVLSVTSLKTNSKLFNSWSGCMPAQNFP